MKKKVFLLFILVISIFCCCSSKDPQPSQSNEELANKVPVMNDSSNVETKINLKDLTENELKRLVSNPNEAERDLLLEYISLVETEAFYFQPLKEGEQLDYNLITHQYYNSSNNRIVTNELIIYKKSVDGTLIELKHFLRAGRIKGSPDEIPMHLYFYINDLSDTFGLYLWEIDGEKGIGKIILEEAGYRVLSNNGKYLFKEKYIKHIFNDKEEDFPVIVVYSILEKKIIKEYDQYEIVKSLLTEGDFIDGLYYEISKKDNTIIAELGSMGSNLPTFFIDQDSLNITGLE